MSKYYVQSGTMRTVVQAETTRKAALWAVHQAMQQVLPMEGNATNSNDLRTGCEWSGRRCCAFTEGVYQ